MSKANRRARGIKKAPTLMEVLVQTQERMATLEARVDRIEIHQRTQQVVESNNEYLLFGGGEISDEHYYGDGMKGEHNAD